MLDPSTVALFCAASLALSVVPGIVAGGLVHVVAYLTIRRWVTGTVFVALGLSAARTT